MPNENETPEFVLNQNQVMDSHSEEIQKSADITLGKVWDMIQNMTVSSEKKELAEGIDAGVVVTISDTNLSPSQFQAVRNVCEQCNGTYLTKAMNETLFDTASTKNTYSFQFATQEDANNFIGLNREKSIEYGFNEDTIVVSEAKIRSEYNLTKYRVTASDNEVKLIYNNNELTPEQFKTLSDKVKENGIAKLSTSMYHSTIITFPIKYSDTFIEKARQNDLAYGREPREFRTFVSQKDAYKCMMEFKKDLDAIVKENFKMKGIRQEGLDSYAVSVYIDKDVDMNKDANKAELERLQESLKNKGLTIVSEEKVSKQGNSYTSRYIVVSNNDIETAMQVRDEVQTVTSKLNGNASVMSVDTLISAKEEKDFVSVEVNHLPKGAKVTAIAEEYGFKLKENSWKEYADGSIKATFVTTTPNGVTGEDRQVALDELQYKASMLQAKIASLEIGATTCQKYLNQIDKEIKTLINVEKKEYHNLCQNQTYTIKDAPEVVMIRLKTDNLDNKTMKEICSQVRALGGFVISDKGSMSIGFSSADIMEKVNQQTGEIEQRQYPIKGRSLEKCHELANSVQEHILAKGVLKISDFLKMEKAKEDKVQNLENERKTIKIGR